MNQIRHEQLHEVFTVSRDERAILIHTDFVRDNHHPPVDELDRISRSLIRCAYGEHYFQGLAELTPRFILDFDALRPFLRGNSFLEFGAGTGRALSLLRLEGKTARGIDSSPTAVSYCTTRGFPCQLFQLGGFVPIGSGSYDTVFSMHFLEHCESPFELAEESFRIAKEIAVHLIPLGRRADPTHEWFFDLAVCEELFGSWSFEFVPETDCLIIWKEKVELLEKQEQKNLVPRKEVVTREGQTFEQTFWVRPDWFAKPENLAGMSDSDIRVTFAGLQDLLIERNQAWVDAIKRGVTGSELKEYRTGWEVPYNARRPVGRELRRRGMPYDLVPVRTDDRAAAISRWEKAPPEEKKKEVPPPAGSLARAITEIGMTEAEASRYSGERITGPYRREAYHEFLKDRDIPSTTATGIFFRGWGTFVDAPLVVNIAMASHLGYNFDEVYNRIPAARRAKYDKATIERATGEVGEVIPAVAAWTRQYYKEKGFEKVKLYRGLRGPAAEVVVDRVRAGEERIHIGLQPVSAWTTDEEGARTYAENETWEGPLGTGAVISIEVPIERLVWSSEATGVPEAGEHPEVLIASDFKESLRVHKDSIRVTGYGRKRL